MDHDYYETSLCQRINIVLTGILALLNITEYTRRSETSIAGEIQHIRAIHGGRKPQQFRITIIE